MKSFLRKKQKAAKSIDATSSLATTAERLHIQAHLALTELRLSLTGKDSVERRETLGNLHHYWQDGVFPVNTTRPGVRTPIFIDEAGTHCAVGALMVDSGNDNLAQSINNDNPFVLIEELEDSRVSEWLDTAGLTKKEAALIQPGYGFTLERVSGGTNGDKLAAVATIACMVIILIFVGALIRLLVRRPRPASFKGSLSMGLAVIAIAGISLAFLPGPVLAASILMHPDDTRISIECTSINERDGKWNSVPEYDKVCKDYDSNNPEKTPGWINPCTQDGSSSGTMSFAGPCSF